MTDEVTDDQTDVVQLSLADLDADSRMASGGWRDAPKWYWVEAVLWVARSDPQLMALARGYRFFINSEMPKTDVGRACQLVLAAYVPQDEWRRSERLLISAVEDGRIEARHGDTGELVTSGDHSPDANLTGIVVPSAAVMSYAESLGRKDEGGEQPPGKSRNRPPTERQRGLSAFLKFRESNAYYSGLHGDLLLGAYRGWCAKNGKAPYRKSAFYEQLKKLVRD